MNKINQIRKRFSTTSKLLFQYQNQNCKIVLNNEKVLNSLDLDMMRQFRKEIDKWEQENNYPKILLITAQPGAKAFSAGGDIKDIYQQKISGSADYETLSQFFKEEYELDYLIANLQKKNVLTVSMWNGIVMGGGCGISFNCKYKVACEKTQLAMPESRIGLFVDIGMMYNLSKIHKGLALAMAIACERVKGKNLKLANFAQYYVPLKEFQNIENNIMSLHGNNLDQQLDQIISEKEEEISKEDKQNYQNYLKELEVLESTDIEEMFQKMNQSNSQVIQRLYKSVLTNSPLSMKISYMYLNQVQNLTLSEVYKTDFKVIQHLMEGDEFFKGVKNLLIDRSKEPPKWKYKTVNEVPTEEVQNMLSNYSKNNSLRLDDKILH